MRIVFLASEYIAVPLITTHVLLYGSDTTCDTHAGHVIELSCFPPNLIKLFLL